MDRRGWDLIWWMFCKWRPEGIPQLCTLIALHQYVCFVHAREFVWDGSCLLLLEVIERRDGGGVGEAVKAVVICHNGEAGKKVNVGEVGSCVDVLSSQ